MAAAAPPKIEDEGVPVAAVMGRPRSPEANARMLRATLEVLSERGFTGLTINEICARAGVARTTFYRRWPDPADAVVEAINGAFRISVVPKVEDPIDYIVQYTLAIEQVYQDPLIAPSIGFIVGQLRANPQIGDTVQREAWQRRSEVKRHLEALPPRPDVTFKLGIDVVLEVMSGLAWSATVSNRRLDPNLLKEIVLRLAA